MESLAGRDPFTPESLGHRLTADYWRNVQRSDVEGLVKSDAWFRKPDFRVVRWMERSSPLPQNHGMRLRGYLTVPETGDYIFWIAARNAGEFWISEDRTKYQKRRVAWISPHEGTGQGISRMARNQWDQFATQRSRPIPLKAGKTYFIEALAQQGTATVMGQLSVAWQKPGDSRRLLAGEVLSTYLDGAEDADDDSLPDEWEKRFGLDPLDNGGKNRLHQGERGDFDRDGLSNLEEFQLNLDPSNPDSDGDGKKDGDEVHSLHTDPGSVREHPSKDFLVLDPAAHSASSMAWHPINDGLTAGEYRGDIAWNFETREPGWYGYSFSLSLNGQSLDEESTALAISVDGAPVARTSMLFQRDQPGMWSVAGPWLEPGRHTLSLKIDNALISRSVILHALSIWRPEGMDFDRDGLPDWYAASLAQGYFVVPPAPVSFVSPLCLEGGAPGEPQRVQVNGEPVMALGGSQWHANVELQPGPNEISTQFPGNPERRSSVTWQATNVLADSSFQLRAGDSLLLAAWDGKGRTVFAKCVSSGGGGFGVQNGKIHRFPEAGTFTISSEGEGLRGTLTIRVAAATLPEEIPVIQNLPRGLTLPEGSLSADLTVEGMPGLAVTSETDSLMLFPAGSGRKAITARLSPGGPILAAAQVPVIEIAGAVTQNATLFHRTGAPEGYVRLLSPLFVSGLPEGATVEVHILRAGVMFPDGTISTTLGAGDFKDGLA